MKVEFHLPTQIKILRSFETSGCVSPATKCNILEDQNRKIKFFRQPMLQLKRLLINRFQPCQTCASFAHALQLAHSCATCTTSPLSPQILTSSDMHRTYRAEARTNDSPRRRSRNWPYTKPVLATLDCSLSSEQLLVPWRHAATWNGSWRADIRWIVQTGQASKFLLNDVYNSDHCYRLILYSTVHRLCVTDLVIQDPALVLHGPGSLSRYSDSQRGGQSGDRIPVVARFSAHVQTGPRAHPAS